MNDLVESLRHTRDTEVWELCEEAADAIERLTAENERLRAALQEIADADEQYSHPCGPKEFGYFGRTAMHALNQQRTNNADHG